MLPANATSDVLDPAVQIVTKVHAHHSETIDTTLNDSLADYLSRTTETRDAEEGSRRGANQSLRENNAALEAFLEKTLMAVFSHESLLEIAKITCQARVSIGSKQTLQQCIAREISFDLGRHAGVRAFEASTRGTRTSERGE